MASVGVPVCPEVPIAWSYIYPVAAIDSLTGLLWWLWQANMPKVEVVRVCGAW